MSALYVWHDVDFWTVARWFNVIAAALVVVLLTGGTIRRWHAMPARFKRIMPWVVATYVVIAYGSGEVAAQPAPVPPGIRVAATSLILIGLIGALLFGFDDEDYGPTEA